MKKKIVYLGGSFQILGAGHVKAFELAKSFGDYLIVGLNTDELILSFKNQKTPIPYDQRKVILDSIKYIDEVIPVKEFSPLSILKEYNVDVFVLTKEWESSKEEEITYMKSKGSEIRFSPRFKGVTCTSELKKIIIEEAKNKE